LPGEERVEIAAHVAHADNAICEKQGEKDLFAPGRIGVDACEMDVHIPEAGEKKFSGGIDGARGLRDLDLCSGSDGGDAATFDKNGLIELRGLAGGIN
jgi:hypothetical protein